VLESGEPREVHHFALLLGYGASAVNPYLAFETVHDQVRLGMISGSADLAEKKYRKAIAKGIVKVISKMGISTVQSYHGAQIFEALGLSQDFVDEYFTSTPTRIAGIGIDVVAREVRMRQDRAYPPKRPIYHKQLGVGGNIQWRFDGDRHLFNPLSIAQLQHATRSGDYNAFWAERDLLRKTGGVRAAVLMSHAFNDWNVVPEHSVRIINALKGKVPLLMYYHQGGHGGNPPMEMMNKWFTRFLYGVQNGIEKGPKAWIVRETDLKAEPARGALPAPTPYADYPNPDASVVILRPSAGGVAKGGLARDKAGKQGTEKLVDNVEFSGAVLAKAERSTNRLLYATSELRAPLHISGTPRLTLKLASSKPAANLSVWLVVLPWTDGRIGPANLITRGWADPQNHESLKKGGDYHSLKRGKPLTPGQFYRMTFDLQPEIARRMGYHDRPRKDGDNTPAVERFMRRYFLIAKEVGVLTREFCAKLEGEEAKKKPHGLSRFLPGRKGDISPHAADQHDTTENAHHESSSIHRTISLNRG